MSKNVKGMQIKAATMYRKEPFPLIACCHLPKFFTLEKKGKITTPSFSCPSTSNSLNSKEAFSRLSAVQFSFWVYPYTYVHVALKICESTISEVLWLDI